MKDEEGTFWWGLFNCPKIPELPSPKTPRPPKTLGNGNVIPLGPCGIWYILLLIRSRDSFLYYIVVGFFIP
jgi:hypothetical protein